MNGQRLLLAAPLLFAASAACPASLLRASPASQSAPVADWERRLRDEYPAAFDRLRERYSRVHGALVSTIERTRKGVASTSSNEIQFFFEPGYLKIITYGSREESGKTWEPYARVTCLAPLYSFSAVRKDRTSPVTLKNFSGPDPDREHLLWQRKRDLVDAPFAASLGTIKDLLFSPGNRILSVAPLASDGRDLVEVNFEATIKTKSGGKVGTQKFLCTAVLDPGADWALQEFSHGTGKLKSVTNVEYRTEAGGIPVPVRVVYTTPGRRRCDEFKLLEFGASPPGEFTLKAAGLPDLTAPGAKSGRNWTPYWLIGLGLLAGLGAIVLKGWLRRPRGASS